MKTYPNGWFPTPVVGTVQFVGRFKNLTQNLEFDFKQNRCHWSNALKLTAGSSRLLKHYFFDCPIIYTDTYSQYHLVHRHLNNAWYNKANFLSGKPYLAIIASNKLIKLMESQYNSISSEISRWKLDSLKNIPKIRRLPKHVKLK